MKTLKVKTTLSEYDVIVGSGVINNLNLALTSFGGHKAIIITDENVAKLYSEPVKKQLKSVFSEIFSYVIPPGEASKNLEVVKKILSYMLNSDFTKEDTVIALGGGVVGDISALCASLYMRGVKLIQMPTTLLSSVDSSIGGKTGVNLDGVKNIIGTFYQPDLVVCDIATFKTLPANIFSEGIAEIIKYGIIDDAEIIEMLEGNIESTLEELIIKSLSVKAKYVLKDEFDLSLRKKLNFGHTVAHAIEKISNYNVSHGEAVAIGVYAEAYALYKMNVNSFDISEILNKLYNKYSLKHKFSADKDELIEASINDKKNNESFITLTKINSIGSSDLYDLPKENLSEFFVYVTEVI